LATIPYPEKATFSNDAGPIPGNEVLGDDPEGGMNETPWQRFGRSPVGRGAPGGQPGIMAGPAAGNIGEQCTAGESEKLALEMNPL
jgi:hypothetical protein